jgi:hypothetical protein
MRVAMIIMRMPMSMIVMLVVMMLVIMITIRNVNMPRLTMIMFVTMPMIMIVSMIMIIGFRADRLPHRNSAYQGEKEEHYPSEHDIDMQLGDEHMLEAATRVHQNSDKAKGAADEDREQLLQVVIRMVMIMMMVVTVPMSVGCGVGDVIHVVQTPGVLYFCSDWTVGVIVFTAVSCSGLGL